MAYADDLFDQADQMLSVTSPTEADLRRSVSNAYYGLFHFLTGDALDLFCPARPQNLPAIVRRGFQHGVMKNVCKSISSGRVANLTAKLQPAFSDPFEPELVQMAKAFVSLQQQRHSADYALHEAITPVSAGTAVSLARAAVRDFRAVGRTDNVQAFLMSLLLHDLWRAE